MLRSAVLDGWKTVRGREERKRRRTEGRSWFCLRLGAMMATALLCRLLGSSMVVVVQEGRSWCWLGWKSLRREWCSTRVSIFHLSELNEKSHCAFENNAMPYMCCVESSPLAESWFMWCSRGLDSQKSVAPASTVTEDGRSSGDHFLT